MDSSTPWPRVIAKQGETSWPIAQVQNGLWQNWMDGGAGRGLRKLLLHKLILQRNKQRAPLVTQLLLPAKWYHLILFLLPPKAKCYHIWLEALLGHLAASVELLVSQVWQEHHGRHLSTCERKPENPGSRYWDMLRNGVLKDFVSRLKWKSQVETLVWIKLCSRGRLGRIWEAHFPVRCLGLWLG